MGVKISSLQKKKQKIQNSESYSSIWSEDAENWKEKLKIELSTFTFLQKHTSFFSEWAETILWEDPDNYTVMTQYVLGAWSESSFIKARLYLLLSSPAGLEYCQTLVSDWTDAWSPPEKKGTGSWEDKLYKPDSTTETTSGCSHCPYIQYNVIQTVIKWSTRQRWTQGCGVRSYNKSQCYYLL